MIGRPRIFRRGDTIGGTAHSFIGILYRKAGSPQGSVRYVNDLGTEQLRSVKLIKKTQEDRFQAWKTTQSAATKSSQGPFRRAISSRCLAFSVVKKIIDENATASAPTTRPTNRYSLVGSSCWAC